MDIQVAQTLFDSVDASLKTLITGGTAKVMIGIGGVVGTFWLLSFAVRSIQWLYMGLDGIFKDVVFEILKMAFITAMAFNVAWYVETIVPVVTGLPVWMGGILSGHEGNQNNQVDTLISSYVDGLIAMLNAVKISMQDLEVAQFFMGLLSAVIYLLAGLPFMLVAVGTLLTLKVSTTIMLALGPIFIAFALFDQTRHWFMGWVATVAGFMLTNVMFAIVLSLELAFINSNVIKNGQIDTSLMGVVSMLLYFATFTLLATELPNYAASIMGGASAGGVTGMGGIVGKAAGLSAAGRASKAIFKKIGSRFGNKMGSA